MKQGRILLVDDECCPTLETPEAGYMWYYRQALQDAGFEVVEVTGPDDGLRRLEEEQARFRLVLVDIMMPPGDTYKHERHRNGVETGVLFVQTLARKFPELPIIVLTQLANPDVHEKIRRAGNVREVVFKLDCTPFQLVDRIWRM